MDLYLVRHAIAEERDPRRWPDDALRPLSARGRARFRLAAAGLRRLGARVDLLLTSPCVRARETAGLLAGDAGWPAPSVLGRAAPGGRPEGVLADLGRVAGDAGAVALVGHEPDLQRLASFLLTGVPGSLAARWRKGGIARLGCPDGLRPGAAALEEYLPPRVLRAAAGRG